MRCFCLMAWACEFDAFMEEGNLFSPGLRKKYGSFFCKDC